MITLLFCLWGLKCPASAPDLNQIRTEFHQAALEEKNVPVFYQKISGCEETSPVILAYKAASEALLAQQVWNPIDKYHQLKRFELKMNQAVTKDPSNLEIRFIRFSVQYYIPRFLGFSDQLKEDQEFISKNIDRIHELKLDPSFSHYIIYFLRETGLYDPEKVTMIESKLPKR